MITAQYHINSKAIDDMEMTISISMPVRDWHKFKDTLQAESYHSQSYKLSEIIKTALQDLGKATNKSYCIPKKADEE